MMSNESYRACDELSGNYTYNPCNCGKVMCCSCFSQISPRTNETWSSIAKSMGKSCLKQRRAFDSDRIVVPNVVYLMNLPQIPSIEDILKSPRFLGQYGRIERIIVHKNCTAHVTFVTTIAAQICIQCLNNFYFDGVRIAAKVGTTKYPQDVNLEKIAQANENESPPPVCYDPVFPPPPFGIYNSEVEPIIISQIDTSDIMPNIEVTETDQLDTLPICYNKKIDARNMALLISPLEMLKDSERESNEDSLCINDLRFGTGGIHNSVWSQESPTHTSNTQQIRSSFVPRLGIPLLNLTSINTQLKPSATTTTSYQSTQSTSPLPSANIKSTSIDFENNERHCSPRGIDEIDLLDSPPSNLNYFSAEYFCPTKHTSTIMNEKKDVCANINLPSTSGELNNKLNFEWQRESSEYFQNDFIQSTVPSNNSFSFQAEYHHGYNFSSEAQPQFSQAPFWSLPDAQFMEPYPCHDYYSPRPPDFYSNYNSYQYIPLTEPCLPNWENPNMIYS